MSKYIVVILLYVLSLNSHSRLYPMKSENLPSIHISAADTILIDKSVGKKIKKGKKVKAVVMHLVCFKKKKVMSDTYKCETVKLDPKI